MLIISIIHNAEKNRNMNKIKEFLFECLLMTRTLFAIVFFIPFMLLMIFGAVVLRTRSIDLKLNRANNDK